MSDTSAINKLVKAFGEFLKSSEKEQSPKEHTKSVNVEERKCLEVMFEANTKDAHGNWYTEDTLVKGLESYKANEVPSNLFHMIEADGFKVEDAFILDEETTYVNGEDSISVQKGSVMAWVHYSDDELWELKKSKDIGGLSPGFLGDINKGTGEITNVAFSYEDYRKMKEEE